MAESIRNKTANVTASTFCLGTIGWGTKTTGDSLDRLYDAFRESGGSFFDSAHVYAFWLTNGTGASERALGEIVRRRNDRDNVILATKGGHPDLSPGYPRADRYLAPEVIAQDIADSLDRLGVNAIDLYFLHRDDPRVPVGEIMDMLDEHVRSGRIGQIGASNWTTARIAEANDYAIAKRQATFVANQAKFSLGLAKPSKDKTVPTVEQADLDWHASSGLTLCAYTPTANGYFATNGAKGAGGLHDATSERLARVNALAHEFGVTPNQVALAWLLHQPFPVIPILGTASVEHLVDALGARDVRLTGEQVGDLAGAKA